MGVEQDLETVRQAYGAFSSGDLEALMQLYDEDLARGQGDRDPGLLLGHPAERSPLQLTRAADV
jgi:hypothetical protein